MGLDSGTQPVVDWPTGRTSRPYTTISSPAVAERGPIRKPAEPEMPAVISSVIFHSPGDTSVWLVASIVWPPGAVFSQPPMAPKQEA